MFLEELYEVLIYFFLEKNSLGNLHNISICVDKFSHTGLEQHGGGKMIKINTFLHELLI